MCVWGACAVRSCVARSEKRARTSNPDADFDFVSRSRGVNSSGLYSFYLYRRAGLCAACLSNLVACPAAPPRRTPPCPTAFSHRRPYTVLYAFHNSSRADASGLAQAPALRRTAQTTPTRTPHTHTHARARDVSPRSHPSSRSVQYATTRRRETRPAPRATTPCPRAPPRSPRHISRPLPPAPLPRSAPMLRRGVRPQA